MKYMNRKRIKKPIIEIDSAAKDKEHLLMESSLIRPRLNL